MPYSMHRTKLAKIARLGHRAVSDIVAPYRFGFNVESVGAARTPQWLYSLNYTRHGMEQHYGMKRDAKGIVMMSHYVDHDEAGHYYSPVKIAHYALGAWNDHIRGDAGARADFMASRDWLMQNREPVAGAFVWRTPTTNRRYDLPANYTSAIVQGLILSVLARSLVWDDDPEVRAVIEGAAAFFHCRVADGGILADSPYGTFYEEYPCAPPSHVVNGFMFSLNGLWDAAQMGSATALERYTAAVPTLYKLLPAWITQHWSYYDLRYGYDPAKANLATRHYQYLHVDQLKFFAAVDCSDQLALAVTRLEKQMRNPIYWFSAYLNKCRGLIGKSI
jgi:hypothetical protein